MFEELRVNELYDLQAKKLLEEGTAADVGKFRLSAKGLTQFDRLLESLPAKDQVVIQLKLAANAYSTPTAIKAFMK